MRITNNKNTFQFSYYIAGLLQNTVRTWRIVKHDVREQLHFKSNNNMHHDSVHSDFGAL